PRPGAAAAHDPAAGWAAGHGPPDRGRHHGQPDARGGALIRSGPPLVRELRLDVAHVPAGARGADPVLAAVGVALVHPGEGARGVRVRGGAALSTGLHPTMVHRTSPCPRSSPVTT